jgi:hypothetical protein
LVYLLLSTLWVALNHASRNLESFMKW